jgi:glycerophosphoryl diester phosphodiesterase
LRACGAKSVSIELDMFHPDDAKALHDAGFSIRVNLPRSEALPAYRQGGRDIVSSVLHWIAEGLIDTVSGDDVPFLARLVERARAAGGPPDGAGSQRPTSSRRAEAQASRVCRMSSGV